LKHFDGAVIFTLKTIPSAETKRIVQKPTKIALIRTIFCKKE